MDIQHKQEPTKMKESKMMYKRLGLMIVLSFIAMYILMYAMVDTLSNIIPNVNQFYMAGLMTMPMVILEMIIMGSMYKMRKLNVALIATGLIGMVVFFLCIHQRQV